MYDPVSKRVIISRDMVFEEDKQWDWSKTDAGDSCAILEWGDEDEMQEHEHNPLSPAQGRVRRAPTWIEDYVSSEGLYEEEENSLLMFAASNDPIVSNSALGLSYGHGILTIYEN